MFSGHVSPSWVALRAKVLGEKSLSQVWVGRFSQILHCVVYDVLLGDLAVDIGG